MSCARQRKKHPPQVTGTPGYPGVGSRVCGAALSSSHTGSPRDVGEPFHSPEGGLTGATRALALRCPRTAVASIVLGGARTRDSDERLTSGVGAYRVVKKSSKPSHTPHSDSPTLKRASLQCRSPRGADVRMAIASSSPVPLCNQAYAQSVGLLGSRAGALDRRPLV